MTVSDFLDLCFPELMPGEVICLARPHRNASGMQHLAASKKTLDLVQREPGSWYTCVSTLLSTSEFLRRRREDCVRAHVLMLDDIGTKSPPPPVAPSLRLETSEGNFQYVYLLDPVDVSDPESAARYERILTGIHGRDWGDAGASGVNRLFRIPGSVNQKPGRGGFTTVVSQINTERRWEL
jgi:RepB DNA-primase from phage plasmid